MMTVELYKGFDICDDGSMVTVMCVWAVVAVVETVDQAKEYIDNQHIERYQ